MRWLVLVLAPATFLSAAKTHGRQVRLERELAGYWHVTFGARNPIEAEGVRFERDGAIDLVRFGWRPRLR